VTFRFTLNTLIMCIIYIVGKTGCYTLQYGWNFVSKFRGMLFEDEDLKRRKIGETRPGKHCHAPRAHAMHLEHRKNSRLGLSTFIFSVLSMGAFKSSNPSFLPDLETAELGVS